MAFINMRNNCINFTILDQDQKEQNDRVILFTPFFPFDNRLAMDFFSEIIPRGTRQIFSSLSFNIIDQGYSFEEYLKFYENYLNQRDEKVILIGYGFFSFIFIALTHRLKERVEKLILIEPDLTNQIFTKLFDTVTNKKIVNFNQLVKFYSTNKIAKRHLNKINLNFFKNYFISLNQFIKENKILFDILEKYQDITIFWNVMEKESWPLAQIITEDFKIPLFRLDSDLYEVFFSKSDQVTAHLVQLFNMNSR